MESPSPRRLSSIEPCVVSAASPVAANEPIATAVRDPVLGNPVPASPGSHPMSSHPDVTTAVPAPVPRRPYEPRTRGRDDDVPRRRRRCDLNVDADGREGRRREAQEQRRRKGGQSHGSPPQPFERRCRMWTVLDGRDHGFQGSLHWRLRSPQVNGRAGFRLTVTPASDSPPVRQAGWPDEHLPRINDDSFPLTAGRPGPLGRQGARGRGAAQGRASRVAPLIPRRCVSTRWKECRPRAARRRCSRDMQRATGCG